jgi:formylglycine-generating enzyme required for sulfatase activity
MGEGKKKVRVKLTHTIEVMSTPVTQWQWAELMRGNPSKFVDGEYTIIASVNGKQIKMQPDNPVEMVTWWSAVVYLNELSKRNELTPAYDLSGIEFVDVLLPEDKRQVLQTPIEVFEVAARGALGTRDPTVSPKINAPKGNIYQAEGFRFPTEAEAEYLLRAAGTANGYYYFGNNEADLKKHAWYIANSDSKTNPVAQLKPLTIDGPSGLKNFYDLYGNVWEWNNDWHDQTLKGGNDPQGAKPGSVRVMRGGSWFSDAQSVRSAFRNNGAPDYRYYSVGFRPVRTIR